VTIALLLLYSLAYRHGFFRFWSFFAVLLAQVLALVVEKPLESTE